MSDLRDLYQEVIIDHNRSPRNFHTMPDASCHADGFNPLCGDKVSLYLQLENGVIKNTSFQGSGCAISTASASLLTEQLKGKTIKEAATLFEDFHHLMTEANIDLTVLTERLGKLSVLAGVREYPSRIKCATLVWHTLQAALNNQQQPVSTE